MRKRLLLALLLSCGLLLNMPNAEGWRLAYAIWNFGHVVLFGLLAHILLTWRFQQSKATGLGFGLGVIVLMAGLGTLVEVGQWLVGRDCEVLDIIADACGAAVAVLFHRQWRDGLAQRWQRKMSVMLGAFLLTWSARDVMLHSADAVYRWWRFPELYSPNAPLATAARLDLLRITIEKVLDAALSPTPLLRVKLWPGEFSTFTLDQMNANWQGHKALEWRWYNPGSTLPFNCRAHDLQHESNGFEFDDRFNAKLNLLPGWNTLRFPLQTLQDAPATRKMDLSHMRSISCFAYNLAESRTLYLDKIVLEP